MKKPRVSAAIFSLGILLSFVFSYAGGKHLAVMAPDSRQNDLKGKPHKVVLRSLESSEGGGQPALVSTTTSEYDKDGNSIFTETVDASNKKTDFEKRGYDAEGTWVSLVEMEEGSPQKTMSIFIDASTKRIAKVDQNSRQTEFISYSEHGFEVGTVTQTAAGKVVEKTTIRRNSSDKEEHVVFEEPPGKKTSEISIRWNAQEFEEGTTFTMYDKEGGRIVITFEYPDVDPAGNWLTQIKKQVLHTADGMQVPMPTEINKRTITYHP